MQNQTNPKPDKLEQEREKLVRRGNQQISDEIKDAVDLAYKLSVKKPPHVVVETLTSGSHRES